MSEERLQIGRLAQIVGLSLRTIRYYEEIGLITPSSRTPGGFRLYDPANIDRLLLIKRMKPLGYPLEEMSRLLSLVGVLDHPPRPGEPGHEEALTELRAFAGAVGERIEDLRTKLAYAEEFHERVQSEIARRADLGQ